jgi:uncharacterized protein YjbI with pentapeptide repeats
MHLKNLLIILLLFPASSYASEAFPNGSCEGPNSTSSVSELTGCGYVAETGFYAHPDADGFAFDMSGQDLSGAKLKDVNFWDANLKQANLTGAELTAGNFYNADLQGADLSAATFEDANLWGANLTGSNVEGTNFTVAFGNDNTICPNSKSWGETDNDCGF